MFGVKIEFKTPALEAQLPALHPAARGALLELAREVAERGLRHVLVTDLLRTPEDQLRIYGDAKRYSNHLSGRAWDVRVKNATETRYTEDDAKALRAWLAKHWPSAEILLHGQFGTSDNLHLHFATRSGA